MLEYKNASRCICAHDVFMQMHLCRTQKEREHVDVGRLKVITGHELFRALNLCGQKHRWSEEVQ